MQESLRLDARQVEALQAVHVRLTDRLLNVTSERLHISNLLKVRELRMLSSYGKYTWASNNAP